MEGHARAAGRVLIPDGPPIIELLLLGAASGFLAGLLGIGGGMIMVPFLMSILSARGVDHDLSIKMSIATSMATIVFTSMSSVRAHHRRGAVRWDLVRSVAPGVLVGGLLAGAGAFRILKGAWLGTLVAVFVAYSAARMLRPQGETSNQRPMVGRPGQFAAGGAIGFLSGLVGAGGAFVSVPLMTWCSVPIHQAVATSAALGFPIALSNSIGYLVGGWSLPPPLPGAFGFLYLPALAVIATASVSLAPLGARVAHSMDMHRLRCAFSVILMLLAGYMLFMSLRP